MKIDIVLALNSGPDMELLKIKQSLEYSKNFNKVKLLAFEGVFGGKTGSLNGPLLPVLHPGLDQNQFHG